MREFLITYQVGPSPMIYTLLARLEEDEKANLETFYKKIPEKHPNVRILSWSLEEY